MDAECHPHLALTCEAVAQPTEVSGCVSHRNGDDVLPIKCPHRCPRVGKLIQVAMRVDKELARHGDG
jgi:hypothetical protein